MCTWGAHHVHMGVTLSSGSTVSPDHDIVQSFKKIGIKLYEELRSQGTHCHNIFIQSEVRKWQSSQSGKSNKK